MLLLCIMPFSFFQRGLFGIALSPPIAHQSRLRPQQQMWWAAAAAGLASGSRLVGLALLPSILYLAWRRRASLRDLAAIVLIAPSGLIGLFHLRRSSSTIFSPTSTLRRPGAAGMSTCASTPRSSCTIPERQSTAIPATSSYLSMLCLRSFSLRLCRLSGNSSILLLPFSTTLLIVVQGAFTWVSLGRYLLPAVGVYFVAGALLTQPRWSGWPRDCLIVGSTLLPSLLAVLYGHAFWVV